MSWRSRLVLGGAATKLVFACLVLIWASACDESPVGPPEAIDELPRALTQAEQMVLARSNAFGFGLLREVDARREADKPNTLLSPLSASMALGMAMEGAEGETYTAMRDVLGFQGLAREEVNASYRGLLDILLELDPAVELRIANSAWARLGYPFLDAYFNAITTNFDATVRELDFSLPSAKDTMNDWVSEQTAGHIPTIVDLIGPLDVLFLINAVYFKGDWTTQFKKEDTFQGSFRLADGTTVTVPTMSGTLDPVGLSGYPPQRQVMALPYGGQAFEMVIVLPAQEESVDELATSLDDATWVQLMDGLHYGEVMVQMPKYELEWGGLLNDPLTALGMGIAFNVGGAADFSRMTGTPSLFISRVRQKVYMKVDEEGTTAAAATSVVMTESAPMPFMVDRPFVVAIRERLSGTILFLGIVRDPR